MRKGPCLQGWIDLIKTACCIYSLFSLPQKSSRRFFALSSTSEASVELDTLEMVDSDSSSLPLLPLGSDTPQSSPESNGAALDWGDMKEFRRCSRCEACCRVSGTAVCGRPAMLPEWGLSSGPMIKKLRNLHNLLRTRRAFTLYLLRTSRALIPLTFYNISALLVFNGVDITPSTDKILETNKILDHLHVVNDIKYKNVSKEWKSSKLISTSFTFNSKLRGWGVSAPINFSFNLKIKIG